MFSDVIHDALYKIEKSISKDYSYPSVYPKEYVVNMIKSMLLCVYLSDARLPDGTFGNKSISDLEFLAHKEAIDMYDRNINNEY